MYFEKNQILSLSKCLNYLEKKCNYMGIKDRFKEYVYGDFPMYSEMYAKHGVRYYSFSTVVEDEKRMHDEAIFRSIFDVEESGTYFRA